MPVNFDPPKITRVPYDENFKKNVGILILIAQKKHPDALNTTQKTPAICNVPFRNKSRKTAKNATFSNMQFFAVFLKLYCDGDFGGGQNLPA